jgi:ferredoxin
MRIDERDTLFARMAWDEGSAAYADYYCRHPEKEARDAAIRRLPGLGSPECPTFDPMGSPVTDALFTLLANLRPLSEGDPAGTPSENDPAKLTRWALGLSAYLGADDAGIAAMTPGTYYSHRGRHQAFYGAPVEEDLPFALVLSVAMDPAMIHKGPRAAEMAESARGYLRGGVTAIAAAECIRQMGYRARAHTDANYLVVAPRAAVEAGLGVFGRSGLVIHRRFGPCHRLAVVTTDMPLVPGSPDTAGPVVKAFCESCGRCAKDCPGRAIPAGPEAPPNPNGWPHDGESCYETWRRMGTDCGICISTCPFSWGFDWKALEETSGDPGKIRSLLDSLAGGVSPRPYDPDPPSWWR